MKWRYRFWTEKRELDSSDILLDISSSGDLIVGMRSNDVMEIEGLLALSDKEGNIIWRKKFINFLMPGYLKMED